MAPDSERDGGGPGLRACGNGRNVYASGEAARLLGIPPRTMRRYLQLGKIRGQQNPITGTWQVTSSALARFAKKNGHDTGGLLSEVNVLLVDAEPAVARMLERALGKMATNATLDVPTDACDALIQIGASRPDLVIIEARMPLIRGRDLLVAIRNNAQSAKTRVLATSRLEEELKELLDLGADGTLPKPFTPEELMDQLEHLLPSSVVWKEEQS